MIPQAFITEWRAQAPWTENAWVEQDLIISRALIEIFNSPGLKERLAFRGGTAIHKLYLHPAARYSEDIDLVQTNPEPIGETFDAIRSVLDPWLGEPNRRLGEGRVSLVYRFDSEDITPIPMRLKVEINSREHFSELGLRNLPFDVGNRWFSGHAQLTTFALEELLGTKLRALYQRKKGRDLFDLIHALDTGSVDCDTLLACFLRYMNEGGHSVTRAQFEANLAEKRSDPAFRADVSPILRSGIHWDFDTALTSVLEQLIAKLPGDSWKGN
ncbi:MAG: nucleotidyl transferase AbiEii/AbiGii toxin family protein [Acidobacteria bacterium]|uniref:Nucleotidyl transferase AbiEii/AbiGii toxin family protein n=1 Tax=Candidatus Polarisedimenticola svalbardensis TaxID=2886004 RepID=A0A8J6XYP6_9BACT|nr:nucleotidyl transferase AbiEii/AbiGii toxin family protein [Candidatus Polarisedimenticola svalbardensis]